MTKHNPHTIEGKSMNRAVRMMIIAAIAAMTALIPTTGTAVTPSAGQSCAYYMAPGCFDPADDTLMGRITANPSLLVRRAPNTKSPKVKKIRKGATVWIACWTYGQFIRPGKGRPATDVWDWVVYQNGRDGWVADAFVNTGGMSPSAILPNCNDY